MDITFYDAGSGKLRQWIVADGNFTQKELNAVQPRACIFIEKLNFDDSPQVIAAKVYAAEGVGSEDVKVLVEDLKIECDMSKGDYRVIFCRDGLTVLHQFTLINTTE
jgi:hypothetical protein